MHPSEDQDGTARRAVTQADADRCCAASEQDDASPTAKSIAAIVAPPPATSPGVLLPPVNTPSVTWDRRPPDRAFVVSRNVLLSVFLI